MSAIVTIISPALIERYIDGEVSYDDKLAVENAIASDDRARRIAIKYVWAKAGLSLNLLEPRGHSNG